MFITDTFRNGGYPSHLVNKLEEWELIMPDNIILGFDSKINEYKYKLQNCDNMSLLYQDTKKVSTFFADCICCANSDLFICLSSCYSSHL